MKKLFFDLETIPDLERVEGTSYAGNLESTAYADLTPPEAAQKLTTDKVKKIFQTNRPEDRWVDELYQLEMNSKKPRKTILDACSQCKEGNLAWVKKCSLAPSLCKIIAGGFAIDDGEIEVFCDNEMYEAEEDVLMFFWEHAREMAQPVGFNINDFDLPVIFFRSALRGIKPTRRFKMGRYSDNFIDLWVKYTGGFGGGMGPTGLKELAHLAGIEIPAGDGDGGQVWKWFESGDYEKIAEYQRSDVEITRQLYKFMKGYWVHE